MTAGLVAIALIAQDRKGFDQLALLFLGLSWIASGAITFIRYLKETKPPERVGG